MFKLASKYNAKSFYAYVYTVLRNTRSFDYSINIDAEYLARKDNPEKKTLEDFGISISDNIIIEIKDTLKY